MIASQLVRRYALNQQIAPEVADQEIVLHYALKLLNEQGLVGRLPDGSPGPLLFKGGTALRTPTRPAAAASSCRSPTACTQCSTPAISSCSTRST
jgi:hypothetical protein